MEPLLDFVVADLACIDLTKIDRLRVVSQLVDD